MFTIYLLLLLLTRSLSIDKDGLKPKHAVRHLKSRQEANRRQHVFGSSGESLFSDMYPSTDSLTSSGVINEGNPVQSPQPISRDRHAGRSYTEYLHSAARRYVG